MAGALSSIPQEQGTEKAMNDKHIPDDLVVFNILSRLPWKTPFRLTLVCKTWSSLLRNPGFIASHQRYTKLSRCNNESRFLNIQPDSYCLVSEKSPVDDQHEPPMLMWPSFFNCRDVIGRSCNGLLCLRMRNGGVSVIVLWNPLTRKFKNLDTLPHEFEEDNYGPSWVLYGYGYDQPSDDYRVVKITMTKKVKKRRVDIYRLSTDSWHGVERVQVPASLRKHHAPGLYLNGAFHWVTWRTGDYHVDTLNSTVSYNFNEETFREIVLHDDLQDVLLDLLVGMNEYKGSLALLTAKEYFGATYYLWVMEEYGVAESWNRKALITTGEFSRWPKTFLKDGVVLSQKKCKTEKYPYALYDHKGCKSENFGHLKLNQVGHIVDFKERLVFLDSKDGWFDTPATKLA